MSTKCGAIEFLISNVKVNNQLVKTVFQLRF